MKHFDTLNRIVAQDLSDILGLAQDVKTRCQGGDRPRLLGQRVMTLAATEFIRRFLLNVLPRSFVKIRHYGFLANRFRTAKLEQCRRVLNAPTAPRVEQPENTQAIETSMLVASPEAKRCPCCGQGRLRVILHLEPLFAVRQRTYHHAAYDDTS